MKILPDEIPDDAAPLSAENIPFSMFTNADRFSALKEGENVFVTLLDGSYYIGRYEAGKRRNTFTVGNSKTLFIHLVETARIV